MTDGTVTPCVLGHFRLAAVVGGRQWADTAASIPRRPALNACPPNDSGDCGPANNEAYDDIE